jgi:hypothetical protein
MNIKKPSKERQPWNPYPLHSLSAADKFSLSPAAISVLIYLAARTNYTGRTVVGQTRIAHDLRRSKDFVTAAMKELRDKKVITTSARGRKAKQADLVVLSPSILPADLQSDPAYQEDKCNPARESNPAEQEDSRKCNPAFDECNPAQQGETYRSNLTDNLNPNLAGFVFPSVSQSSASLMNTQQSESQTQPEVREHEQQQEPNRYASAASLLLQETAPHLAHAPSPSQVDATRRCCAAVAHIFSDTFQEMSYTPFTLGLLRKSDDATSLVYRILRAALKDKFWSNRVRTLDDYARHLESKEENSLLSQYLSGELKAKQDRLDLAKNINGRKEGNLTQYKRESGNQGI